MAISPVFLLTQSKRLTLSIRVNMLLLSFLLKTRRSSITIGAAGLLIFCRAAMFHVKHCLLLNRNLSLKIEEVILMLQKTLEALTNFLCEFVISHPRVICSIVGALGALALIAAVVSINVLIGG